jgi:hypothetical protein
METTAMKRHKRQFENESGFAPGARDLVYGAARLGVAWAKASTDVAFESVRMVTDVAAEASDSALDRLTQTLRHRDARTSGTSNDYQNGHMPPPGDPSPEFHGFASTDLFSLRRVADAITRATDAFASAFERRIARNTQTPRGRPPKGDHE